MSEKLVLTVPGIPKYVSTVRLAVSSVASHAGLDIEAIEDIRVAVSEACNNIIEHAGIEGSDYQVICDTYEDRIDITVVDEGVGYDSSAPEAGSAGKPSGNAADKSAGSPSGTGLGLGIVIMRTLMDEVEMQSEPGSGTSIRMTKYIPAI